MVSRQNPITQGVKTLGVKATRKPDMPYFWQKRCTRSSSVVGMFLAAQSRTAYLGSHRASPITVPASQTSKNQVSGVGEPAARSMSLCRRFNVAAPTSLVTCSSTGRQHRASAAAVSTTNGVTPNRQRNSLLRLRADRPRAISPPHRMLLNMEWMVTVISSWNPRLVVLSLLSVSG